MKALSLWQPWASLVVLGLKQYETRSWKTSYRGTLVIHAGKEWNNDLEAQMLSIEYAWGVDLKGALRGVALGTVELVDIFRTEAVLGKEVPDYSMESDFGDYTAGRYAWKLANPIAFPEPILCAGHQRLWEVE